MKGRWKSDGSTCQRWETPLIYQKVWKKRLIYLCWKGKLGGLCSTWRVNSCQERWPWVCHFLEKDGEKQNAAFPLIHAGEFLSLRLAWLYLKSLWTLEMVWRAEKPSSRQSTHPRERAHSWQAHLHSPNCTTQFAWGLERKCVGSMSVQSAFCTFGSKYINCNVKISTGLEFADAFFSSRHN